MSYEAFFESLDNEPFRPFRIRMASGRTFEVRHPEMIKVSEHFVVVFEYREEDERLLEGFKTLGLSLVESIEYVDETVVSEA